VTITQFTRHALHEIRCAWCKRIISYEPVVNSHGMCADCLNDDWKNQIRRLKNERSRITNPRNRPVADRAGMHRNRLGLVAVESGVAYTGPIPPTHFEPEDN